MTQARQQSAAQASVAAQPWTVVDRTGPARWMTLAICAGLASLTLAAYFPCLWFDFVNYDDPKYVSANVHVAQGLTPATVWFAWTTSEFGNWIPVTWMSYLLDATLFGIRPGGFHATNLVGHAANVCLIYYVWQRMTGCAGRSAVVAALFAIHPLHVQSVAWIAERKDILSTFWLLAAIVCYERYARRPAAIWYIGVCAATALGLMAKSMLVTLPVLLLLLDYWPLNRWAEQSPKTDRYPQFATWFLAAEKGPLLLLAFADGVMTIFAQKSAHAISGLETFPLAVRIGNAVRAIGWYLWKTAWPTNLSPFYPYTIGNWRTVTLSLLVVAAISAWVVWNRSRRRYLVTGWLWFLVSLLPVLGLLQVGGQAQADRYTYVPHIGLFVMLVWTAADIANTALAARWIVRCAAAAMFAGCFVSLRQELEPWRNSRALWEHALQVQEENYLAHQMFGVCLYEAHEPLEAERHFLRALELAPDHFESIISLGILYLDRKQWDEAFEYIEWARRIKPHDPRVEIVWRDAMRRGGAERSTRPASQREPNPRAKYELEAGRALYLNGNVSGAKRRILESLRLDPDDPEALNCLGIVLARQQEWDQADDYFRRAMEVDATNPDYVFNLADMYEHQSRWADAQTLFEKVLQINPADGEARLRLNRVKKRQNP